ncbi:Uncharacterised protein [Bordetella pertussis]|nr:Uncharacterised protein [Bordetella pertussis]
MSGGIGLAVGYAHVAIRVRQAGSVFDDQGHWDISAG